jgi:hypothetical protein
MVAFPTISFLCCIRQLTPNHPPANSEQTKNSAKYEAASSAQTSKRAHRKTEAALLNSAAPQFSVKGRRLETKFSESVSLSFYLLGILLLRATPTHTEIHLVL